MYSVSRLWNKYIDRFQLTRRSVDMLFVQVPSPWQRINQSVGLAHDKTRQTHSCRPQTSRPTSARPQASKAGSSRRRTARTRSPPSADALGSSARARQILRCQTAKHEARMPVRMMGSIGAEDRGGTYRAILRTPGPCRPQACTTTAFRRRTRSPPT